MDVVFLGEQPVRLVIGTGVSIRPVIWTGLTGHRRSDPRPRYSTVGPTELVVSSSLGCGPSLEQRCRKSSTVLQLKQKKQLLTKQPDQLAPEKKTLVLREHDSSASNGFRRVILNGEETLLGYGAQHGAAVVL